MKENKNEVLGKPLTEKDIEDLKKDIPGLKEDDKSVYLEGAGEKTHHISKIRSADSVREWAEEKQEEIKKEKEEVDN